LEILQIFFFAAACPLLMRLDLRRVNAFVSKFAPRLAPEPSRIARTVRLVELTLRFGRPFIVPGCLTRSLTLCYFLRKLGVDVALVFGAGQTNRQIAAHCWLELDGQPYLEKLDPRSCFIPFYRFASQSDQHVKVV
jgi:hypothetical protein